MTARSTALRFALLALAAPLLAYSVAAAWSGWSELSGGGPTDAALSATLFDDAVYVFGKGTGDKKVYVTRGTPPAAAGAAGPRFPVAG